MPHLVGVGQQRWLPTPNLLPRRFRAIWSAVRFGRLARFFNFLVLGTGTYLAAGSTAFATINAELMVKDPFAAGWSGTVQGRISLSQGNVRLIDVGGTLQLQYQRLFDRRSTDPPDDPPFIRETIALRADGQVAEQDGRVFIGQAFAYLRWTRMWHRYIGTDAFSQLQYNRFLRLQSRILAGAGVRLYLLRNRSTLSYVGSAYMLEREQIEVAPGANDRAEQINHRWTNYATLRIDPLSGRLVAQNTIYAQPRFDRFRDLRVLNTLEVMAAVTEAMSIGTTLSVLYDSEPPSDVEQVDVRIQSNIRFTL